MGKPRSGKTSWRRWYGTWESWGICRSWQKSRTCAFQQRKQPVQKGGEEAGWGQREIQGACNREPVALDFKNETWKKKKGNNLGVDMFINSVVVILSQWTRIKPHQTHIKPYHTYLKNHVTHLNLYNFCQSYLSRAGGKMNFEQFQS